MTSEQLQAARLEKWRQKANPLLTLEDAAAWIESTGVSLFLPRKTQLQTPAPSFVEAVLGEPSATPAPAAIQNAFELAARLFAEEKATPLNLLGAASEQPDFLVSPEALPYVFALRGDRDWKRGPREKSSPLVVDSWKLLKREGALTTPELQNLLGREVTEAAVLRSLSELWAAMRVLPIYVAGEATAWELFESRHQKAMQIGGGMAQATALSALISLYLDTAIAAASDEIEIFLSPLSPRSRIREVVHGLAATRQLLTIPLGAQSLLHIAGGLPAFPEIEAPEEVPAEAEPQPEVSSRPQERRPFAQRDRRRPFTPREREERPRREGAQEERGEFRPRRAGSTGGFSKPDRSRTSDTGTGDQRPFKKFPPRDQERPPRREWKPRREEGESRPRREGDRSGFGKPYRSRTGDQAAGEKPPRREWKPREEKRPFERKEWKPRREGAQGERGEFRPRRAGSTGGFSKPYRSGTSDTGSGDQRPFKKFPPRDQERPPRKEWKPRREEGEHREFRPRRTDEPSERREFKPRPASGRGFKPRREAGEFGDRPKSPGEKRSGAKRSFEGGRGGFDRKKPPQRERRAEGGDAERPGKSFSRPGSKSGKSFAGTKRSSGSKNSGGSKSFGAKSSGRKPGFGAKRPSRPGGKPAFGKRPNNRKGKKSSE